MRLREVASAELSPDELRTIRALLDEAFGGDFSDEDMAHGLGGRHWLLEDDGVVLSHASTVERVIEVGGRRLRTGYVEAVATTPALQGTGLGSRVMEAAGEHIRRGFELGALSTGEHHFYERLGWERWAGPTFVRHPDGTEQRTPEEDDGIMVLRTPATPSLDRRSRISCEWRAGDAW